MATTCDYCHKPLSLMRRLRGEQFCSTEHLDMYSAQQAEFALERLAASVIDRPNTERAPAIPKPSLKPKKPTSTIAAPVSQQVSHPSAGFLEQESSYDEMTAPMAPYIDQSDIEPRGFDSLRNRKTGFAPLDKWGKAAPAWSMPAFRTEPSDPRTWNAGKLAARIPPAAGCRELLSLKAPEPIEFDSGLKAQLPRLALDVARLEKPATGTVSNALPGRLMESQSPAAQPGTLETRQEEYPSGFTTPQPVFSRMGTSPRNRPGPAGNRPDRIRDLRTEARPTQSSAAPVLDLVNTMDAQPHVQVDVPIAAAPIDVGPQNLPKARLTPSRPPITPRPWTLDACIPAEYSTRFTPQSTIADLSESILTGFNAPENRLDVATHALNGIRMRTSAFILDEMSSWQLSPLLATEIAVPLTGVGVAGNRPNRAAPKTSGLRSQSPAFTLEEISDLQLSPALSTETAIPLAELWTVGNRPDLAAPAASGLRSRSAAFALNEISAAQLSPVQPPDIAAPPDFAPNRTLELAGPRQGTLGLASNSMEFGVPNCQPNASPEVRCAVSDSEIKNWTWSGPQMIDIGPSFGSHLKPLQDAASVFIQVPESITTLAAAPRVEEFRANVKVSFDSPGLRMRESSHTPKTDAVNLNEGPLVSLRFVPTASNVQVGSLMPYEWGRLGQASKAPSELSLQAGMPLAGYSPLAAAVHTSWEIKTQFSTLVSPIPSTNRCQTVPPMALTAKETTAKIAQAGPLAYRPVALFVLPQPQFSFLPHILVDEQRYVTQVPIGTWQLPPVRQVGYRALGSFGKVPLHMPDRYLRVRSPEMHPASQNIALGQVGSRQDLSGMPVLEKLTPKRIHPADYWAWPALMGTKLVRNLAEYEYQHAGEPLPGGPPPARRFGPGRAGLQIKNRSADGLAKSRGLRQEPYSA